MEPRVDIGPWLAMTPPTDTIESYYDHCSCMVEDCYHDVVKRVRETTYGDWITPEIFLREYVWVVFASGFNSKILAEKFIDLMRCYSDIFWDMNGGQLANDFNHRWDRVEKVIANKAKHFAVWETVKTMWLARRYNDDWWSEFKCRYLGNVESMTQLPRIADVTKYHLARNLGHDCVKPDKHLSRLAESFGFDDPHAMCSYLSGLRDERVGVIDLVLFYGASSWGTSEGFK